MHEVAVVGCGPTGMMLAGELRLAGVDVVVLERRKSQELAGSRGGGIHARTIELLDQRGIAERFLAEGRPVHTATFGGTRLDSSRLPTRHPYTLALFQNHIERLLLQWIEELGAPIRRSVEVVGLEPDDEGVRLRLASGDAVRARYVVGADGGRSVVRREARIGLQGPDATRSSLIAEAQVTRELPSGAKIDERGVHGLYPMGEGRARIVVTEAELGPTSPPTPDDLRRELIRVFGTDFGVHNPTWLSRFTDATKQATTYRADRVLLAGDAAHVHSPTGGLGIGLGIQDAVNLGWKLGQVLRGVSGDELLDTYHAERHPAGARALKFTMAQSLFQKADPRQEALRDLLDEVLCVDGAESPIAALISGLDVAYDLGAGHPLLGRRMPDLDIVVPAGARRVFELMHRARPVVLQFGESSPDLDLRSDRVDYVRADRVGPWELPGQGVVDAPTAVLIRPDGHVAWVGEDSVDGLSAALSRWCGVGAANRGRQDHPR